MRSKKLEVRSKKFIALVIALLGLVVLAGAAQAITTDVPANSVVNPVSNTLYVVNNGAPRIDVYKASGNWTNSGTTPITIPAGSQCYGLAVSADGTKLYVSLAAGSLSKTSVYSLDSNGLPTGSVDLTKPDGSAVYWSSSSAPGGLALGGDNKLFVADQGVSWFRVFDTASNTWLKNVNVIDPGTGQGVNNLYSIAVTPGTTSYKIYVARRSSAGAIYVYTYNAGTISYLRTITGLTYPTYMKVVNGELFVAVNGTNGIDVQVYNTSNDTLVGNVMSGTVGSYGWTAFDVSADGAWLLFKKAADPNEANNYVYKIMVSAISGNVTATKVTQIDNIINPPNPGNVIACDGLMISTTQANVGLANSPNGNFLQIYSNIVDQAPNPPSNLQQYKLDGVTPIAKGGGTYENGIVCKFTVTDPDSPTIIPSVFYGPVGGVGTRVTGPAAASGSTVSITIPASGSLAAGAYEWSARADDGTYVKDTAFGADSGAADFVVNIPAPTVASITPNTGAQNTLVTIDNLAGTNFVSATTVKLTRAGQSDITATGVNAVSANKITCSFNLSGAQLGAWNVVATNPDGQSGTLTNGFTVTAQAPIITGITPNSGTQGTTVAITNLSGLYFAAGAAVKLANGGSVINMSGINVVSATRITGSFAIPASATPGYWAVVVTNPDGQSFTYSGGFIVNATTPAPAVSGLTPNFGAQGSTVSITNLAGSGFVSGATVKLTNGSSVINATNVTVASSIKITCSLAIPASAPAGYWTAVVTNPDGQTGSLAGAFNVTATPPPAITTTSLPNGTVGSAYGQTLAASGGTAPYTWSITAGSLPAGLTLNAATGTIGGVPTTAQTANFTVQVTDAAGRTASTTLSLTILGLPPAVSGITPNSGAQGATVNITNLAGSNFVPGAAVKLTKNGSMIAATGVSVVSPAQITCSLTIPADAVIGYWNVTVTNPDGQSGTLGGLFKITAKVSAPTVTGITPNSTNEGSTVNITNLAGTGFVTGCAVSLTKNGATIAATGVSVVSPAQITCSFAIPLAAEGGAWDVTVTNPDGQSGTLPGGFTVNKAPAPAVTGITPNSTNEGFTVSISNLAGTNFAAGATVKLTKNSATIDATGVNVVSPAKITCSLAVPLTAEVGAWDVTVTNPNGLPGTLPGGFTINPKLPGPTIASIDPNNAVAGGNVKVINLVGTNFLGGASVTLTNGSNKITATGVNVASSSYISCNLAIPAGAVPGKWNVTVTNPDTQAATLNNGFTVYSPGTAPTISSITPSTGKTGEALTVTINGTYFSSGATAKLAMTGQADVPITITNVLAAKITGTLAIPAGTQAGAWTVLVTNLDGQTGELVDGFTVTAGGVNTITLVSPSGGESWDTLSQHNIAWTTTGAIANVKIELSTDGGSTWSTLPGAASVANTGSWLWTLPSTPTTQGRIRISDVADPAVSGTSGNFTIVSNLPAPTIASIDPDNGIAGNTVTVVNLIGSNFVTGTSVKLVKGAAVINAINEVTYSPTYITCQLALPATAEIGDWNVVVTNPDAKSATKANGFHIYAPSALPPTISLIAPNSGAQGATVAVTLTGTNFNAGATAKIAKTGQTDIPIVISNITATQITGSLQILAGAQTGTWTVMVTNPDTQTGQLVNGFTVTGGGTGAVSNVNIVRDGDTYGSSVTVTWQTDPANTAVDVYARTGDFSTTAGSWTKAASGITIGTYTDSNQVGNGTAKYYKIIPAGATLQNSDLTQDVVGKFDLNAGGSPEQFFISLPLIPNSSSPNSVIGAQATNGDGIMIFDINKSVTQAVQWNGTAWVDFFSGAPSDMEIFPGYAYGYLTTTNRFISIVGVVRNEASYSRTITGGANMSKNDWIAAPYPVSILVTNAGLNDSTVGSDPTNAGTLYLFDINATWLEGAVHDGASTWKDAFTGNPSTMVLQPGKGYMFTNPVDFTWTVNKPY
ncbi:MAG: putative Ig domain-containing protein [Candidatus Saganbacteria bacterium]|nr:putative Ig domain-containing protein [Candidatus Saganbacteria bacterium]